MDADESMFNTKQQQDSWLTENTEKMEGDSINSRLKKRSPMRLDEARQLVTEAIEETVEE